MSAAQVGIQKQCALNLSCQINRFIFLDLINFITPLENFKTKNLKYIDGNSTQPERARLHIADLELRVIIFTITNSLKWLDHRKRSQQKLFQNFPLESL